MSLSTSLSRSPTDTEPADGKASFLATAGNTAVALLLPALLLVASAADADPVGSERSDRRRHGRIGPRPEVAAACVGKKEGDTCSFTIGDTTRTGICGKGRSDKLMCRPALAR